MGQTVHGERYEDIIFQALPAEYEGVQNASYEKRDFGLVHIMAFRALGRRPRHRHAGSRTHQERRAVQLLQGSRTPPTRLHHPEDKGAAAWTESVGAARPTLTQPAGVSPRKGKRRTSEERERRQAPVVLIPQVDQAQRCGLPNSAPQDRRRER